MSTTRQTRSSSSRRRNNLSDPRGSSPHSSISAAGTPQFINSTLFHLNGESAPASESRRFRASLLSSPNSMNASASGRFQHACGSKWGSDDNGKGSHEGSRGTSPRQSVGPAIEAASLTNKSILVLAAAAAEGGQTSPNTSIPSTPIASVASSTSQAQNTPSHRVRRHTLPTRATTQDLPSFRQLVYEPTTMVNAASMSREEMVMPAEHNTSHIDGSSASDALFTLQPSCEAGRHDSVNLRSIRRRAHLRSASVPEVRINSYSAAAAAADHRCGAADDNLKGNNAKSCAARDKRSATLVCRSPSPCIAKVERSLNRVSTTSCPNFCMPVYAGFMSSMDSDTESLLASYFEELRVGTASDSTGHSPIPPHLRRKIQRQRWRERERIRRRLHPGTRKMRGTSLLRHSLSGGSTLGSLATSPRGFSSHSSSHRCLTDNDSFDNALSFDVYAGDDCVEYTSPTPISTSLPENTSSRSIPEHPSASMLTGSSSALALPQSTRTHRPIPQKVFAAPPRQSGEVGAEGEEEVTAPLPLSSSSAVAVRQSPGTGAQKGKSKARDAAMASSPVDKSQVPKTNCMPMNRVKEGKEQKKQQSSVMAETRSSLLKKSIAKSPKTNEAAATKVKERPLQRESTQVLIAAEEVVRTTQSMTDAPDKTQTSATTTPVDGNGAAATKGKDGSLTVENSKIFKHAPHKRTSLRMLPRVVSQPVPVTTQGTPFPPPLRSSIIRTGPTTMGTHSTMGPPPPRRTKPAVTADQASFDSSMTTTPATTTGAGGSSAWSSSVLACTSSKDPVGPKSSCPPSSAVQPQHQQKGGGCAFSRMIPIRDMHLENGELEYLLPPPATGHISRQYLLPDLANAQERENTITVVFDLDETLCNNRRMGPPLLRPGAIALLKKLRGLGPSPGYKTTESNTKRASVRLYDDAFKHTGLAREAGMPATNNPVDCALNGTAGSIAKKNAAAAAALATGALGVRVEIVLWTASVRNVALPVVSRLDPDFDIFDQTIYRDLRWYREVAYTKDLRRLGRLMDRVVIVENAPMSVSLNRTHSILVNDFVRNRNDRQLFVVQAVLEEWITRVNKFVSKLPPLAPVSRAPSVGWERSQKHSPQQQQQLEQDAKAALPLAMNNNSSGINMAASSTSSFPRLPTCGGGGGSGKVTSPTAATSPQFRPLLALCITAFLRNHAYVVPSTNYIRLSALREVLGRFPNNESFSYDASITGHQGSPSRDGGGTVGKHGPQTMPSEGVARASRGCFASPNSFSSAPPPPVPSARRAGSPGASMPASPTNTVNSSRASPTISSSPTRVACTTITTPTVLVTSVSRRQVPSNSATPLAASSSLMRSASESALDITKTERRAVVASLTAQ